MKRKLFWVMFAGLHFPNICFFHLYLGQVHMVHEYLTFSVVIQSPSYPSENNLFTWPTYIFALFNKFMFHALLGPLLSVSYFIVSRGMVCLAHY